MTTWGIVATIKAPADEVLGFAAYHLARGAHRLYLYLDAPDAPLEARLRAHPQIKVVQTDETWWAKRRGRPDKHQSRQFANARHAYNRRVEVDWLAHIDVDEFLWPVGAPVAAQLAALPPDCLCARVRPIEALAGVDGVYKAFHPKHAQRSAAAQRLYPTYGRHLNGGFLSHVAGKLFYRTGVAGLRAKIHNITVKSATGDEQNPGEAALTDMKLCHNHAQDWDRWYAHFRYRHAQGSYRDELKAAKDGLTMHHLFAAILESDGETGLRAFFDEVCAATPDHVAALEREGLLWRCDLGLDDARARHFPDM